MGLGVGTYVKYLYRVPGLVFGYRVNGSIQRSGVKHPVIFSGGPACCCDATINPECRDGKNSGSGISCRTLLHCGTTG